ncbi:RfaG Glycosyltransferase [Candidatus Nanopelagicaceae bacterium]
MHVCHVVTTIARGGAEIQLLMLAKGQIERGYSVTVCPLKGELELEDEFKKYGVEVVKTLHAVGFLAQIKGMRKLADHRYSIIHAHLPQAELLVSLSGLRNYVVSRHFGGQFFPGRNIFVSRWLSKLAVRNAGCVIAISESVAQYLIRNHELQKSTLLKVVPYGFDKEVFLGTNAKLVNPGIAPNKKRVFGTIARLSEEKDLPTLIKAFHLHQQNSEFSGNQLEVYGEGALEASLRQLISDLSLQDCVQLKGRTQIPGQVMNSFDVFILTSKFEGFGMVLLEAMSLGKPIICSRIDTALEVLDENGAAIFFETGKERDLELKMRELDELLPWDFKKQQQKRLERYSIHKSVNLLHETYENLLTTRS